MGDGQAGEAEGYMVTGERGSGPDQSSSSRERKLDLRFTDDLMVIEPDEQLQMKARTCPGRHRGPEPSAQHLGMKWWQA